jgi:hypothetical protein
MTAITSIATAKATTKMTAAIFMNNQNEKASDSFDRAAAEINRV